MIEPKIIKEIQENGFTTVDNFLDENLSNYINQIFFENDDWMEINQIRDDHYSHVFKTDNPQLPRTDEKYSAKFSRSESLEKTIEKIYREHFASFLLNLDKTFTDFNFRCYKLDVGDYYRIHTDDYTSKLNLIYYVNKRWCWDWGGILNICSNDDPEFNKQIFPKFNRVVLINNELFRSPHYVSPVNNFALSSRFSIVSFNK